MLQHVGGPGTLRRWLMALAAAALVLGLTACGSPSGGARPGRMQITLLGLNDSHGNLQPPGLSVNTADAGEAPRPVAAGASHTWPLWWRPNARPTRTRRWSRRAI